jgi:hypothetical protein
MIPTLLTDGSSDTVLLPILRWLLVRTITESFELKWADLRGLSQPPRDLRDRIATAIKLYPCEIIFVHRDSEGAAIETRLQEILVAHATSSVEAKHIGVVPVRMQEAWLLHDEASLREAAGRPSGDEPLGLPPFGRIESIPDPKLILHTALKSASGASGRRLKSFRPSKAAHRLAELISDWSPLVALPAFQQLEHDTRTALTALRINLRY